MKQFALAQSVDLLALLFLVPIPLFGLVMLLSTAPNLFYVQLINIVVGLALFFIVTRLNIDFIRAMAWPLYIFSILLLLSVFVLADPTRGSYRWIEIGFFRIQPSEIVKPPIVIFFAHFFATHNMRKVKNVLTALGLFAVPFLIIFKEPDLGSALVIAALFFGLLYTGGIRLLHIAILVVCLMAALPIGWQVLHDYQRERVVAFLNPDYDPLGKTYNLNQSMIAVGSGELMGRGLGHGTQTQLKFLPEHTTDFIFASLGEELGFIGSATLLLLYILFFWRLIQLAEQRGKSFSAFVIMGVAFIIVTQAFVHIGGNIGILPVTGITLPFVSYGGSSVASISVLLGLLFRVQKER